MIDALFWFRMFETRECLLYFWCFFYTKLFCNPMWNGPNVWHHMKIEMNYTVWRCWIWILANTSCAFYSACEVSPNSIVHFEVWISIFTLLLVIFIAECKTLRDWRGHQSHWVFFKKVIRNKGKGLHWWGHVAVLLQGNSDERWNTNQQVLFKGFSEEWDRRVLQSACYKMHYMPRSAYFNFSS